MNDIFLKKYNNNKSLNKDKLKLDKKSLYNKDIKKLLKSKYLCIDVKGLKYGRKLNNDEIYKNKLFETFNIDLDIKDTFK